MKRSRIERRTELRRKKYMPRRRTTARLVKLEDGTKAPKREVEFGQQAKFCRRLPCVICSAEVDDRYFWDAVRYVNGGGLAQYGSEAHHETTRGSGRGRDEHCVPLCHHHHIERHTLTLVDFETRHDGIDLLEVAAQLSEVVRG